MFKIDHKIPVPARRKKLPTKYPWLEMEVEDSFFVRGGTIANMRSTASSAGKRHARKFTARPVEGGVRVWRVK